MFYARTCSTENTLYGAMLRQLHGAVQGVFSGTRPRIKHPFKYLVSLAYNNYFLREVHVVEGEHYIVAGQRSPTAWSFGGALPYTHHTPARHTPGTHHTHLAAHHTQPRQVTLNAPPHWGILTLPYSRALAKPFRQVQPSLNPQHRAERSQCPPAAPFYAPTTPATYALNHTFPRAPAGHRVSAKT